MTDDERRQRYERLDKLENLYKKVAYYQGRIKSHHDTIAIYEDYLDSAFKQIQTLKAELSELP